MDIDSDTETEWSTDLSADETIGASGELLADVDILRQIINHEKVSAHRDDLNKIGYCLAGNPRSTPFKGLPNKQKKSYKDAVLKLLDEQLSCIDRRNCNVTLRSNESFTGLCIRTPSSCSELSPIPRSPPRPAPTKRSSTGRCLSKSNRSCKLLMTRFVCWNTSFK